MLYTVYNMHQARPFAALILFLVTALSCQPRASVSSSPWWSHVSELASDRYQGRETGTTGHLAAAEYVAAHFRALGMDSLGLSGYQQSVPLLSRTLDESRSRVEIVGPEGTIPLELGTDVLLQKQFEPAATIDAPLVFVGYGVVAPEVGHDDLAGLDLRGAVAVYLNGGAPASVPDPLRAHVQFTGVRWKRLRDAGAIGWVAIPNPKRQEISWKKIAEQRMTGSSMQLAAPDLDERAGQSFGMTLHLDRADRLLEGAGLNLAGILALADSGKVLPRGPLHRRIRATVASRVRPVASPNVVAALPGTDPSLRNEYVVLTAHLDHLGVGHPVDGDSVFNGAMDNAAGVASLLEIARAASRPENRPRRSLLFVATTAEEKGLLGSRYFTGRPPVPIERMVGVLNMDMALPIIQLRRMIVFGLSESSLGDLARDVLGQSGIDAQEDPQPHRNRFIRSDQYSFIVRGVPALAFMFGYHAGAPEESLVLRWNRERYHAPSDDLDQPVNLAAADRFTEALLAVTKAVANRPERPRWKSSSFFQRFADNRDGTHP